MPQITLSQAATNAMISRVIGANTNSLGLGSPGATTPIYSSLNSFLSKAGAGGFASAFASIYVMQGAIPVGFGGLTNRNARASDILIRFSTDSNFGSSTMFSNTVDGSNPALITSQFVNAAASGIATWFWILLQVANASGTDAIHRQAFGSIGPAGSGADLEMDNVNIVAGQPYRIVNFGISFPSTWTY